MHFDEQPQVGLGSLLRALLERLDSEVDRLYREAGEEFRPRYYPVARMLLREPFVPLAILVRECGVTHSAVSQTVSEMARRGLVETRPGMEDARERIVWLSDKGRKACARLEPLWDAVHQAAAELDAELRVPLSEAAVEALDALARRPFEDRIRQHLPGGALGSGAGLPRPRKGSR